MRTTFRSSFRRDLKKIREKRLLNELRRAIEAVEEAHGLHDIQGVKRLSGYSGYYRIRVGDYRIGVFVEDNILEFVRCLHRRDIYRYFP